MVSRFPTTASTLLAALEREQFSPKVNGRTLVFPSTLPASHRQSLQILHTGVRAILMNQTWFGCSSHTGWSTSLATNQPIPGWVELVAVAGDPTWHRLPALSADLRAIFFTTTTEPRASERVVRNRSSHGPAANPPRNHSWLSPHVHKNAD